MGRRSRATAAVLGGEALRLFFPLAALHAAAWPLLWVAVYGFNLPLARTVPPSLWHGHEMLIGAFGAALLGFIFTAVPEWSNQDRPRGPILFVLAGLWGVGRLVGLLGADVLGGLGALVDLAWLGAIVVFLAFTAVRLRAWGLRGFLFWIGALWLSEAATRYGFLTGDLQLARTALWLSVLAFTAVLGLALARITPPITNRILDPDLRSTPFRPHPGRRNLGPILIAAAMVGTILGASAAVEGFLLIAAGAAYMDRSAEAFIGRAFFRSEVLALGGSSALAGAGLLLVGASRLALPIPELAGLHLLTMGGLGLGVLSVFAIAGKLHTGQALGLEAPVKGAFLLLVGGTLARVAAAFGLADPSLLPPLHLAGALMWAGAFLLWLQQYWPFLSSGAGLDVRTAPSEP
ncbi:NnrS family protein [Brevundimonas sp.]|uniref:NnrS family protein n=1 Tax=Brevundimonas sp. TaxID=1871086 RepID=UPI002CDF71C9|nr:NnrS family protein [Brevundimonas sp.]HWQ87302.1 NnrS family protein [Brevundimonas sp.]